MTENRTLNSQAAAPLGKRRVTEKARRGSKKTKSHPHYITAIRHQSRAAHTQAGESTQRVNYANIQKKRKREGRRKEREKQRKQVEKGEEREEERRAQPRRQGQEKKQEETSNNCSTLACSVASVVSNSATPWTVACQGPLWSGLPGPPPGDLPSPRIKPGSPSLQVDSLPLSHWGSTCKLY